MATTLEIKKSLGGVEDLLFDATSPATVDQLRAGQTVAITKINGNTIPSFGKFGEAGFKSINTYIDEKTAKDAVDGAYLDDKGFVLTVGAAGLMWDGGAPSESEITLAQYIGSGKYRWLGKTAIGSDNWKFRGRVSGSGAVNADDFVTKAQLPSESPHGTYSYLDKGTNTTHREWTAKDLHNYIRDYVADNAADLLSGAIATSATHGYHYSSKHGNTIIPSVSLPYSVVYDLTNSTVGKPNYATLSHYVKDSGSYKLTIKQSKSLQYAVFALNGAAKQTLGGTPDDGDKVYGTKSYTITAKRGDTITVEVITAEVNSVTLKIEKA